MPDTLDFTPVWLTLRLAVVTTLILVVFAMPIAWWLAHSRSRLRPIVSAVVTLPLVLPPTVLGFYLLLLLGRNGWIGQLTQTLGLGILPFTFAGLVVASVVYSLPFAVQPLRDSFTAIGRSPLEAAATLRAGPVDRFATVALPLARPGLLSAMVLTFAHTLGEFGVVLMIGGNIPGETQVLSLAIYNHVESQQYREAHWLAGGVLVFSFAALYAMQLLARGHRQSPA